MAENPFSFFIGLQYGAVDYKNSPTDLRFLSQLRLVSYSGAIAIIYLNVCKYTP